MIASLRNAFIALIISALVGPAWAASEAPGLKANHPSRYIVQKGDTLWDISGRFLNEPWRWPDVWQANPQIKNPHLIFPGDEVLLSYKDGRPIISVRRRGRRGVTRLSPSVRVTNLASQAIPTLPLNVIQPFLVSPRVVDDNELEAAPYILSVGAERLSATPGGKIYVRGLDQSDGAKSYSVYRKGKAYTNPDVANEVLGFEAIHVADAYVEKYGDPSTLVISKILREVLIGDRLVAVDENAGQQRYQPRPAGDGLSGRIISVVDGVTQIGQYQTVVLNLGARDGLEVGHVFAVYQNGAVVEDPLARDPVQLEYERRARQRAKDIDKTRDTPGAFVQGIGNAVETVSDFIGSESRKFKVAAAEEKPWAEVTLPEERAGTLMVYRPFERVSYALVMSSLRPMHVLDTITKP